MKKRRIEEFQLGDLTELRDLVRAFTTERGATSRTVRRDVMERASFLVGCGEEDHGVLPESVMIFADKVALSPYKVCDEDVAAFKGAGFSEEEIYEITLAASLGVSLGRLEKGLSLLEEGEDAL